MIFPYFKIPWFFYTWNFLSLDSRYSRYCGNPENRRKLVGDWLLIHWGSVSDWSYDQLQNFVTRKIAWQLVGDWFATGWGLVGEWLAFDCRNVSNHILPLAITLLGRELLPLPLGGMAVVLYKWMIADLSAHVFIWWYHAFCKWSQVDRQPIGEWSQTGRRLVAGVCDSYPVTDQ